jgi:molybdopterin synthase sulfur carrier subunit
MIRVVLPAHLRTPPRVGACEQDRSHEQPDTPLPGAVAARAEPCLIAGATAGG